MKNIETATFANGCFWCTEAIFDELKGVISVTSGYSGGDVKHPSYREVASGLTGHAECIQITYDADVIGYDQLLDVFFKTHDPTTLNKQGNDEGTQYRSAIFYHTPEQKTLAESYINDLTAAGAYDKPIVTEVTPFTAFYPAEDYHQQYLKEHGEQPYCRLVIMPKLEKFRANFKHALKKK